MANGLSGDDTIIGTSSNEHLNGGAGEDTILAGLGDDRINGGSGDDVLDGEAGSDTVRGDSGDDQLIYRASENVGATDIYDGGSGQDTLRLELTLAEWLNPSLQLDMANYLAFVAANTLPNGQANNSEFRFTAFDLRVSKLENLEVVVDGVVIDPQDQPVTLTNDAITTNEDSASLAINLLANDSVPDLVQSLAIASPPTQGTLQLALDLSDPFNPIANAVYTPGVALQALAVGETATDTFTYTVTDADGDSQGATVTVTITGTNDGPVITAGATASHIEEPDTTGALPAYASSGVLDFADVDLSDTHTVDVGLASLTWSGDPVVPAATAAALATALSASLAADSTGSGSGNIDWQFDLSNQLVDFLAEGETLTAIYEVTVTDNHGASATQPVTISFTGTNDVPVIAGGDTAGTVQEDGPVIQATGQLDVADPDHNAAHTWTVVGGTASGNADYLFGADSLTIYRGTPANLLFHDDFGDGNPPPDSPDFTNGNPHTYGGVGANGFSETGGRLIFDSDDAVTLIGVGTPDPFVGQNAIVRSFIDTVVPGGPVGLRSGTNFTVEGVFDLVLPDSPREAYGIRLTDRLIGGDGSPPDQQGDDVIELVVRMNLSGNLVVQLREVDFAADTITLIQSLLLNPPAGTDQIRLRLDHAASNNGVVTASFDYLSGGAAVGSQSFTQTGRIFGTETAGTGDDENYTRAEIIAFAPALNDSILSGTYGTLNIAQSGQWNYLVDSSRTVTQNLAQGQTETDVFTVQVTDEHGASDTETITVTVTGTNDGPIMFTGPVSRSLSEDAAATLTATGQSQFSDLDLTDTHTVAPTLQSIAVSAGGSAPAGLAAALAGALTVGLFDPSTGDGHGQLQWDFALDNSDVQFLAAGQTLTIGYRINVSDPFGGVTGQDLTVVITGTNDAPVIEAIAGDSAGTAAPLIETDSSLSAAGTLTVTDRDVLDTATTSVLAVATDGPTGGLSDATLLGFMSVAPASLAADPGSANNLSWLFDSGLQAFDFLAAGEVLELSYTIRATDSSGSGNAVGDGVVVIRIAGTNDDPVISPLVIGGGVIEIADGQPGENTATHVIAGVNPIPFSDQDLADAHTVSVTGGPGYLGTLTASVADPATGDGFGTIDWTFSVADADLDTLAQGEILTQAYTVTVDDGLGGNASQLVSVVLTGSNDAPTFADPAGVGAVTELPNNDPQENAATHTAAGTLAFADVDLTDSHTVTVAAQGVGYLGELVAVISDPSSGDGSGSVGWTFSVSDSALDSLAAGQIVTQGYTLTLDDGHGGLATQTVSVRITGAADNAPRVTPSILFVDDDAGINMNGTWISTLGQLGYSVTYEAISQNGNPVSNLDNFDVVIWSVGDRAYSNLTPQNVSTLSSYLNSGGNLLYAGGHSLYEEPAAASFVQTYLGLTNYTYNMPYVDQDAHLHTTGPGGTYTISDTSNDGVGSWYGGTMLSAFHAAAGTAHVMMEITSGGAHAGHPGFASTIRTTTMLQCSTTRRSSRRRLGASTSISSTRNIGRISLMTPSSSWEGRTGTMSG